MYIKNNLLIAVADKHVAIAASNHGMADNTTDALRGAHEAASYKQSRQASLCSYDTAVTPMHHIPKSFSFVVNRY